MKITGIAITHRTQDLQDTAWEFARAKLSANEGLVLEVQTDEGITGLGYAVEGLHIGEALLGMRQVVENRFAPLMVGRDPFDIVRITSEVNASVLAFTRTKAAVEVALFDLVGKALGVPVYKLLGGCYRTSIPVIRILPIKPPLEMARNAESVVGEGYRYLKVKVGLDSKGDVDRIREIRRAVGPDVGLTVDANQGWTPKAAVEALQRMEEFGVAIVEQPVHAEDFAGLAEVRAGTRILVEGDESAATLSGIFKLAAGHHVDAINLKVGRLGGLLGVKKGAAICEGANLRCRLGFTGASRMNAVADMHVIAATANIDYACEVGEFTRMESDPFEGIEIVNGELQVPELPGLGVWLRA